MKRYIELLESTIQKSTIIELRKYLEPFRNIKKWMIISDYCFDDPNKSNNCISFIIYPYVYSLDELQEDIKNRAKVDLKHTKNISDEFCDLYHSGIFYSMNFVVNEDNCICHGITVESVRNLITQYIEMLKTWIKNQPEKKNDHEEKIKKFNVLLNETNRKTFNLRLFKEIFLVNFLVSYLTYILIKEMDIDIIGWFSDPDKIVSGYGEIATVLYVVMHHTLCVEYLGVNYKQPITCLAGQTSDIFYDELVRIADYICGFVSEFDLEDANKEYKDKYKKISSNIVANNKYISIININADGINKTVHTKIE